jgi:acetolactate decarboxylase
MIKPKHYSWMIFLPLITLSIVFPGRTQPNERLNILFQVSTISALAAGVYDGNVSFKDLKKHGNFGLGTVNALDGEMIGLDGKFYQIKSNGVASVIPDSLKSPFAAVTFFKPQKTIYLQGKINYQQLQQSLDKVLPTKNYTYAIRIQGNFPVLKFRSIPKQSPPYPPLNQAVKSQSVFELRKASGTLIGFRTPSYMQGVNVNGYHLHFITTNRKTGGHILDGEFQNAKVEISAISNIEINLPNTAEFEKADLGDGRAAEVNRIER